MKNVAIIGQGEIGSAIAHILKVKKDIRLRTWDADPEKPRSVTTCETAVMDANIVIVAVPTRALETVFSTLQKSLPKDAIVITPAKGMYNDKFVFELLRDAFDDEYVGVLSGPMLAEEFFSGKVGAAVIAGSKTVQEEVQFIFSGTTLRAATSNDLAGVSVVGTLKNVYATGMGILEGFELGANARGMFVLEAFGEMERVAESFGGKAVSVKTYAGLADFVATATSKFSTNYQFGKDLTKSNNNRVLGEGARSATMLQKRISHIEAYPLLATILAILVEKRPVRSLKTYYGR